MHQFRRHLCLSIAVSLPVLVVAVAAAAADTIEPGQPPIRQAASARSAAAHAVIPAPDQPPPPLLSPPPPCRDGCPEPNVSPPLPVTQQVNVAPRRWAVGAFAGALDTNRAGVGSDFGLLGRFVLGRHVQLEAEIGQTEARSDRRTDRRMGAAILYDFAPERALSPYMVAGVGYGQSRIRAASLVAHRGYAEVGLGANHSVLPGFNLAFDLRAGARRGGPDDGMSRASIGMATVSSRERTLRARVAALFFF